MRQLLAGILLALTGCHGGPGKDLLAEAEQAYHAGHYAEALQAYNGFEQQLEGSSPAATNFNRALSALRSGALREAEIAAEIAAARGGAEIAALRDFLFGNTAFLRSQQFEARGDQPQAPPVHFRSAIAQAELAVEAWHAALAQTGDWPAARRNIERALLQIETLKQKLEAVEQEQKPKPRPRESESSEEERQINANRRELAGDPIQALLDKLARKQREKRALRSAERNRAGTVEQDW